jgi:hypothetical protein
MGAESAVRPRILIGTMDPGDKGSGSHVPQFMATMIKPNTSISEYKQWNTTSVEALTEQPLF